jgi:dihydropteroate synthase
MIAAMPRADERRDDRATSAGGRVTTSSLGPAVELPSDAPPGLPIPPQPLVVGGRTFAWGSRTYVMGILNVTPDSFSGDGLLAAADPVAAAVDQARRMVDEGADLLDVGGESTRPGHAAVDANEELERVVPVVEAVRHAIADVPISIDTTKAHVAERALDAGADLVNDVWGVEADDDLLGLVAARGVPVVLMHNRRQPVYRTVVAEVLADLDRAIARAVAAGVEVERVIVDPGIGFGKTADQNLALLRELAALRLLGRPVLLGTSRKSTLGRVLDLPPDQRVEATVATTVLGVVAGIDIVRVHDVRANVRAARMVDAIVRQPRDGDA